MLFRQRNKSVSGISGGLVLIPSIVDQRRSPGRDDEDDFESGMTTPLTDQGKLLLYNQKNRPRPPPLRAQTHDGSNNHGEWAESGYIVGAADASFGAQWMMFLHRAARGRAAGREMSGLTCIVKNNISLDSSYKVIYLRLTTPRGSISSVPRR